MDDSHRCDVGRMRPDTKEYMLYDSIYVESERSKTNLCIWYQDSGQPRGERVTRGARSPTDGTFLSLRAGYVRVLIL